MHASATGESNRHTRLSCAAENTNAADMASTNNTASVIDMRPAGSSRFAVRGFDASNRASTSLLNPIAAERAVTMHAIIQPACDSVTGCALDASPAVGARFGRRANRRHGNRTGPADHSGAIQIRHRGADHFTNAANRSGPRPRRRGYRVRTTDHRASVRRERFRRNADAAGNGSIRLAPWTGRAGDFFPLEGSD